MFVDESEDLGFNTVSTKHFVIGYVVSLNTQRLRVNVSRLLKRLNMRHKYKLSEFKFSNDREFIRCKMLQYIVKQNFSGGFVAIRKASVAPRLREKKGILYNFIIAEYVVSNLLASFDNVTSINLHLDRSMSREARQHFDSYFSDKLSWKQFIKDIDTPIKPMVFHDHSHQEPCIQIADYIAGSLFQYIERNNSCYYDVIKQKIVYSKSWGISW